MTDVASAKALTDHQNLSAICLAKQIALVSQPADLNAGMMRSQARFRCLRCSKEWEAVANNVGRPGPKATGCPQCAAATRAAAMLAKGEAKVRLLCSELGYEVLGPYSGDQGRLPLRCSADGEEFEIAPVNLRAGQRCPTCSGNPQNRNPARAVAEAIADTTWELVGEVPARGGRASFKCSSCGALRELTWASLLRAPLREDASRACDCRRYGDVYAAYVAGVEGYRMNEAYAGVNVPIEHEHLACGHTWKVRPTGFRGDNGHPIRCPRCARAGRASEGQRELAAYVRSLGLEIQEDVAGLVPESPRSEVDVLARTANGSLVAIDFDGVWWHAEGPGRDAAGNPRRAALPGAALEKARALAAREPRIRFVRVYSDEWAFRKEAAKSRLGAILGAPLETLNARSLSVDKAPDGAEVRQFLQQNHTQGAAPLQTHALALRRQDGSVAAVMTLGERTLGTEKTRQLELLRYCCSPGTSVRGGAGRLLAAFTRGRAPERIVTYADLRWTPVWGSAMYESIGFRLDGRTPPTYDYVHPSQSNRRVSRIALQKHKLLAANPQFDASMTEEQMASALGYARVWNSGSLRYALGG